jgi:hypothetical protein
MLFKEICLHWPALVGRCVSHRILPFRIGASPQHRKFRECWRDGIPEKFNEKVQYKLIHDRRKLISMSADKVAVRDYVQAKAPQLRIPKLLGVFDSEEEVVANIPSGPWVMKGAHGAGMVLISKPGETVSLEIVRKMARRWLNTDYSVSYWEWQYHDLPKRVLFEEYLGDGTELPADYKFFVFHQKVRLITVDRGRFGSHTRDLFYPDWTHLPSLKGTANASSEPPVRPPELERMIDAAQTLGQDTDFVRVDLYLIGQEIYFGELTHSPAAGQVPFEDAQLEKELGSYWHLPEQYR